MLEAREIKKVYTVERGIFSGSSFKVYALEGVSIKVEKERITGLVGPSGCGKSTLARILTGVEKPTEGMVLLDEKNILNYSPIERASKVSIVFQDPYSSLNPKLSIEYQIKEVLTLRKKIKKNFRFKIEKPEELLDFVKVSSRVLSSKPYQLSGGELQRVIIARAIALEPDYLLLDEPTSSLDVSIQSQIIYLLQELKNLTGMGMLFISHDINLVDCISDKVVLMKDGRIVEDEDYFKKLLNSTISLT